MKRAILSAALILAGCDAQAPADPARDGQAAARNAIDGERAAVDGIMTDTRIDALRNQVDRLEAEVSELKGGKRAVETELLAQRLSALEQRVYAGEAPAPKPTATATPRPRSSLNLTLPTPEK